MRKSLVFCLALSFPLFVACSDDSGTKTPDAGKKDITVADQGPKPDQGPANEAGVDAPTKQKVENYVPKDNDVAGWVEDTSVGQPGVESGYTDKDIEDIIDGHHQAYAAEGTTGFAKQEYKKGNGSISLQIWEMNTPTGATNMFNKNKTDGETNSGWTFVDMTGVADAAIIIDAYDAGWVIYGRKGPYVYEVVAATSQAGEEAALKTEAETFIKFLAGNLP